MFSPLSLKAGHNSSFCFSEAPIKRHTLHRTACSSLDILEHDPGEYDWRAEVDVTAWVLSGHAELALDDGRALSLKPGNAVFVPRGLMGHWVVGEGFKTAIVLHD